MFPFIFSGVNKAMGVSIPVTTVVCVYGYSLFIYIIAGTLCILPFKTFRWLVLCLACAHSICFLLSNLKSYIDKQQTQDYKIATMALVAIVQMFLTLCFAFKFYS